ncbi:nuclease-related domain-containing protein [Mycoplasmopsis cricetuli]|uniref:nuclease-related domain-containing protein n=1 Tax=Mycoplasmopsis cricetuli TaxID=171283 RepID=UPI00046EE84F|nr:nuclease-related domain-containing protein [Mycoplasmopsis cricetuli]
MDNNTILEIKKNGSNSVTLTIVSIVLISLFIVVTIVFFTYKKIINKTKQTEGFQFEKNVNTKLKSELVNTSFDHLEGGIYSYNSKMYEVDGILISHSIIVVLEYKSFHGTITGDGANEYVFVSFKKRKKMKFKNPILQNEKHLHNIWKSLGKKVPIASLIVFPDDLKINFKNVESHVILTNLKKLKEKIQILEQASQSQIPEFNKNEVINLLKILKISTIKEQRKFNELINKKEKYERK